MGIFGDLGVNTPNINPVNWGKTSLILLGVLIFIIVGIITFFVIYRNLEKKKYIHKITFVKEVRGQIYVVGEDYAKEITIPYTSIKVFYFRERKTYSPKLIYDVGRNLYYILIGKGGEWINTNLRYGADGTIEINDALKPTRDYANENLKELIKRNWTDKNKDWWKENAHYIFLIILGVVIIVGCIILFSQIKKASLNLNGASENYYKASVVYAESNNDFKEFLKEYFKTSGVVPSSSGG